MIYERLKDYFLRLISERELGSEPVAVSARALTAAEAIGAPRDGDYPILKGKERMIEASFRGGRGHAFTDRGGAWRGSLGEAALLETNDNFRRAVFISSLNALMRHLGLIEKTVHCRDEEPRLCAGELPAYLKRFGRIRKVALVGFQPRFLEILAENFETRASDLDPDNIGKIKHGVHIAGPDRTEADLAWCDLALVTGTTVVNATIDKFLGIKAPVVFYGVSIAGPARVLGLNRFCALGH